MIDLRRRIPSALPLALTFAACGTDSTGERHDDELDASAESGRGEGDTNADNGREPDTTEPVDLGDPETDTGLRDATPDDPASTDIRPRDTGPRDTGPRDGGPRDSGPRDAGADASGLRERVHEIAADWCDRYKTCYPDYFEEYYDDLETCTTSMQSDMLAGLRDFADRGPDCVEWVLALQECWNSVECGTYSGSDLEVCDDLYYAYDEACESGYEYDYDGYDYDGYDYDGYDYDSGWYDYDGYDYDSGWYYDGYDYDSGWYDYDGYDYDGGGWDSGYSYDAGPWDAGSDAGSDDGDAGSD